MKIEIQLYATLTQFLPPGADGKKAVIEVPDGITVKGVMDQLGIPQEHPNLTLVNGIQSPDQKALKDGDILAVFPPIAGGTGG